MAKKITNFFIRSITIIAISVYATAICYSFTLMIELPSSVPEPMSSWIFFYNCLCGVLTVFVVLHPFEWSKGRAYEVVLATINYIILYFFRILQIA